MKWNMYISAIVGVSIICLAEEKKRAQILLLIDFRKAFDSLSHKFIENSMKQFGFKENILQWITILIKDFKININNGGNLSKFIDLEKGCKQGDPISSCLFILGIEILSLKLKNDPSAWVYPQGGLGS